MHKIILLIQMYACCSFFPFSLWFNRFEKNVCIMNDWNARDENSRNLCFLGKKVQLFTYDMNLLCRYLDHEI